MENHNVYVRQGKLEIIGDLIEFLKENGHDFEGEPPKDLDIHAYRAGYLKGKLNILWALTTYVRKKTAEASDEIVEELVALGGAWIKGGWR